MSITPYVLHGKTPCGLEDNREIWQSQKARQTLFQQKVVDFCLHMNAGKSFPLLILVPTCYYYAVVKKNQNLRAKNGG